MGGIVAGCCGAMFAGLCCGACRECGGNKTGVMSRIPYIFLFFLAGVFAIIMSLYGEEQLDLGFYSATVCNSDSCAGNGSVFRVSFCLFVFELLHVVIIMCGGVSFHWLFFAIKFLVFCGALIACFVIPDSNDFFDGYSTYFARYVSALYLLLQLLILISWGYETNEYLRTKAAEADVNYREENSIDEDENVSGQSCNWYLWILAGGSLLLYALSFTMLGVFYAWYTAGDGCGLNETLISLTIVFVIVCGLISGLIGDGSFFVSAVVGFYASFLQFAALQSNPECNEFASQRDTLSLWIGYIVTFFALFYAALRANMIGILLIGPSVDDNDMEQPLLVSAAKKEDAVVNIDDSNYKDIDEDGGGKKKKKKAAEDADSGDNNENNDGGDGDGDEEIDVYSEKRVNVYFHSIMMLAACYFAMLFTNWGTNHSDIATTGTISLWVNMACQWTMVALFCWTLLAPKFCPSRFEYRNSEDDDDNRAVAA